MKASRSKTAQHNSVTGKSNFIQIETILFMRPLPQVDGGCELCNAVIWIIIFSPTEVSACCLALRQKLLDDFALIGNAGCIHAWHYVSGIYVLLLT